MKYYFVYYSCKRFNWGPDGKYIDSYTTMNQDIINVHPLQYQMECKEKYGEPHDSGGVGYTCCEEYKIITWNELTKEEYDKYNGWV